MRFSAILSLAAAATAVTAFHIPLGQIDGVYDSDPKNRTAAVRGAAIEKRSGAVNCHADKGIPDNNNNGAAATNLTNHAAPAQQSAVTETSTPLWAVPCPISATTNPISKCAPVATLGRPSPTSAISVATILPAGWETYFDSDGEDSYGYEWFRTSPGNNFCGRGTNGKRNLE
ncbi:hypothetical protein N431DRAFT_474970 [Stipitochalara longipes BDJ]|nr:hypothetical protein N431DRAFT_474970 [Stipitochalara longipes BDJ]